MVNLKFGKSNLEYLGYKVVELYKYVSQTGTWNLNIYAIGYVYNIEK